MKDNGMKEEVDHVELWSFRADSKLCSDMNVKRGGRLEVLTINL